MWTATVEQDFCPFVLKGTSEAVLNEKHVLIDSLQRAFTLNMLSPSVECLPPSVIMTDQSVALYIIDSKPHVTKPSSRLRIDAVLNLRDPTNVKLQYLLEYFYMKELEGFKTIWLQLCNQAQKQLDLVWSLLAIDPTMGMRAFLDRDDIYAEFLHEAAMVWQCEQVTPSDIFLNFSVNGTCYDQIPILYNNQLFFITPASRDLTLTAKIIPCTMALLDFIKHKFSSRMVLLSGNLIWVKSL